MQMLSSLIADNDKATISKALDIISDTLMKVVEDTGRPITSFALKLSKNEPENWTKDDIKIVLGAHPMDK
jgi:hypothetical protein